MNGLGGVLLFVVLFGVVCLPRRAALVSMLFGTLYIGSGAGLDIAGLNFFPARILGYSCFLRVVIRREFSFSQMLRVDKAFVLLYIFVTTVLLLRAEESSLLPVAKMLDNILMYFAFRGLLRTPDELVWLLKVTLILLVPYVAILAVERATNSNLFTYVGHNSRSWLRDGTARCFGSFRHPALLGSLGATFFPLFVALAFDPALRKKAMIGASLSVAIVIFSNSGGPLSVLAVAILGWALWQLRMHMQWFRRGFILGIIALGLVMKAPIWYLPSKASSFVGGSGWHRSRLMEVAYQNLEKWWLVGMPVEETAGWLPYNLAATGGADITNQFLAFGLDAGLLGMALFIFVIYCGFSMVGKAMQATRESSAAGYNEPLLWGLGVVLAAHTFNWIGITYFDQFFVIWLFQFAALVTVSEFWLRQPESGSESEQIGEEAVDAELANLASEPRS